MHCAMQHMVSATTLCMQAAAYEACRVFKDRLVSSDDAARCDGILTGALRKHWRVNLDLSSSTFSTLSSPPAQSTTGAGLPLCNHNLVKVAFKDMHVYPI